MKVDEAVDGLVDEVSADGPRWAGRDAAELGDTGLRAAGLKALAEPAADGTEEVLATSVALRSGVARSIVA